MSLFDIHNPNVTVNDLQIAIDMSEWGTFKDSLRAPIHRWFGYPAGFSYRAAQYAIREYASDNHTIVFDPFTGTGTTNVAAKGMGIDSIGVEAHPFIHFIAKVKVYWEFDMGKLRDDIENLLESLSEVITKHERVSLEDYPELVKKCYDRRVLAQLTIIKRYIRENLTEEHFSDLCNLALTGILRRTANVSTGWPYIMPKHPKTGLVKPVYELFRKQLLVMYGDLSTAKEHMIPCKTSIVLGDCREKIDWRALGIDIDNTNSIDLAFTSPPYLNNYDYADRTRLELYFFDLAKTWGDITEKVRKKLLTAATTQINRQDFDTDSPISNEILDSTPDLYNELDAKVKQLSALRLQKGGRKDYDLMVADYFNGMFKALRETYAILKPGAKFILVLGDSAPYGVYIPTDEYLGRIALGIGYRDYSTYELRKRGGKWPKNPLRHNVKLKEGVLVLVK